MKYRNFNLQIILLICFTTANILIFVTAEINKNQRINLAINTSIRDLNTQFDIINNFHEKDAMAIYFSTKNNQRVQEILSQVKDANQKKRDFLRVELYNLLKQKYDQMKIRGVLQYHFVMPDNTTFLRMHKPGEYGDNIGAIRYSFANTNKTHESTIGFEQGRTAHAFRNTYPIFDKDGNYLCALDIGYSSESIQNHLTEISKLPTHFLVHKNIFSAKAWNREWLQLKYMQSIEHEDYMFALTKNHSIEGLALKNSSMTASRKEIIYNNMNSGRNFGLYFLQDKKAFVAAFLPIQNIKDKKVVAYLASYKPDSFIDNTILLNRIARSFIFLLLAILFYFIYKNIIVSRKVREFNVELEKKVKKRTHELEQEITDRQQAEDQIKENLKEKEILLKEVHHRIRNNMSTIKGLLTLQSAALESNPEAIIALKEAENRVQSMLVLYDKLFLSSDYINVSTKRYFETLIDEVIQNFHQKDNVKAIYDIEDLMLNVKTIFNLGIIINELITNTMKHAFVGKELGKISVTLSIDEGHAIMTIQDDGIEIPEPISFENPAAGFGFKLVSMLINQLDGSIEIERGNGTKFTIKFNIET
jgi:two-component sensor histidine kinase